MSGWDHPEIRDIVALALREDIGTGDVTTEGCIPADRMATGRFFAREECVLAGVELLPLIFELRGWDPLESTCRHASLSIL